MEAASKIQARVVGLSSLLLEKTTAVGVAGRLPTSLSCYTHTRETEKERQSSCVCQQDQASGTASCMKSAIPSSKPFSSSRMWACFAQNFHNLGNTVQFCLTPPRKLLVMWRRSRLSSHLGRPQRMCRGVCSYSLSHSLHCTSSYWAAISYAGAASAKFRKAGTKMSSNPQQQQTGDGPYERLKHQHVDEMQQPRFLWKGTSIKPGKSLTNNCDSSRAVHVNDNKQEPNVSQHQQTGQLMTQPGAGDCNREIIVLG